MTNEFKFQEDWARFEQRIVHEARKLRWDENSKYGPLEWEIIEVLAWKQHSELTKGQIIAICEAVGIYKYSQISRAEWDTAFRRLTRDKFIYAGTAADADARSGERSGGLLRLTMATVSESAFSGSESTWLPFVLTDHCR